MIASFHLPILIASCGESLSPPTLATLAFVLAAVLATLSFVLAAVLAAIAFPFLGLAVLSAGVRVVSTYTACVHLLIIVRAPALPIGAITASHLEVWA